jgi:branched-chain amino acid transport system substrate-binding protein
VLQIQAASTSDELTGAPDPSGLLNRTLPPDSYQGSTLVNLIEKGIGDPAGKTVAIGMRNDSYGTGLGEIFKQAWEERGGKVVAEVAYDPTQPSFTSEADKLAAKSPDAWVILDFPETYAKVGPALVRTGKWDPARTFAGDSFASSSLIENVPAEALNGIRGVVPGTPDKGVAVDAFDAEYRKADPVDLKRFPFDAQNFDAAMLCYLSAVAAGSTDGKEMAAKVRDISSAPGTKYTWLELPQAIEALQNGDDIDYEGASGSIEMDESGDATAGVYDVYEWVDGKPDINDEVPVAAK